MTRVVTKIPELLGGLLGVLFFVFVIVGGEVYQTQCTTVNQGVSTSWGVQASIPFLWSPGEGCVSHSLTRYVLGKVGVLSDVSGGTQHAYTAALIQKIGTGSTHTVRFLPMLAAWEKRKTAPEPTGLKADVNVLFTGNYTKLSPGQLAAIVAFGKATERRTQAMMNQLAGLRSALMKDRVPTATTRGLPEDSRQFVTDWNGTLADEIRNISETQRIVGAFGRIWAGSDQLVRDAAARNTPRITQDRSTERSSVATLTSDEQRIRSITGTPHWKILRHLIDTNAGAQEIYLKLKADYPSGAFAPTKRT